MPAVALKRFAERDGASVKVVEHHAQYVQPGLGARFRHHAVAMNVVAQLCFITTTRICAPLGPVIQIDEDQP